MPKIMIVEDEEVLRSAYVNVFTYENFEVVEAPNGKVALDSMSANAPNVIILDVLMPVMNGIEFLQAVDIPVNYPHTKILVLSNLSDKETIEQVINLGAALHLVKSSLSPSQLVDAVRNLLK